jgi:hypothetical protein
MDGGNDGSCNAHWIVPGSRRSFLGATWLSMSLIKAGRDEA